MNTELQTDGDEISTTFEIARGLADVPSRRVPMEEFARSLGVGAESAEQLEAELVNAVLVRRMVDLAGVRKTRVPTTGIDVFVLSSITSVSHSYLVEITVTVANELETELAGVFVECISFANSSLAPLRFDVPLELRSGSPDSLAPGTALEYRTRYSASSMDFDGLLVAPFIAQGYTSAGEWAIGQGDAWVELPGSTDAWRLETRRTLDDVVH